MFYIMGDLKKDIAILRELAKKILEIGSLPIQQEKINMWKRLNSLKMLRPMVLIYSFPWHEIEESGELCF